MGKFYISPSHLNCPKSRQILFLLQEETLYIQKQQSMRSLIQLAKKIYSQNPVRSTKQKEGCNPGEDKDYSYVSMIFDKVNTKTKESNSPTPGTVQTGGQVSFSEDYVEMSWEINEQPMLLL